MEFNTAIQQIDRSQKKTTQKGFSVVETENSLRRRCIEVDLTQLSSEQMKQCEWQGEQCSRESGGECV